MTLALLVMTDGRDGELAATTDSLTVQVRHPFGEVWIHDDTGTPDHRRWLADQYPRARVIGEGPRRGFGGAIRYAWDCLAAWSQARHILHLESDFTFNRPVVLADLAEVLDGHSFLAQMALRRQAWNAQEQAAGGVVEQHPTAYTDMSDEQGRQWLEHRLFFTTNPSLYRRDLCAWGWPPGSESEGQYGFLLREQGLPWGVPGEDVRFGFWGSRDDPPWVEHIGAVRIGSGY